MFLKKSKLVLAILTLFTMWSCQKDIDETIINPNNQIPDLTTKVNSSVSGFVTDENNSPVEGATVTVGTSSTLTDNFGYFTVKNVAVVKTAAVVTVSKMGYFNGIKTYMAEQNKSAFFRIKLITKNTSGTINATSGGNVTLSNGLVVALPSNSVVVATSGVAYSGTVNVAAYWINPTGSDVNNVMPGDLRGIDLQGAIKTLTSFGMVAVELTSPSGELLQIAPNKKATLTFPVPSSILSTAPSSIPLWYFDENKGLWKEEGSATKVGNTYVGEVSHFSFWNCDMPNNYVQFSCNILDGDNHPIPYTIVKISLVSNPYNATYGYTDSSGYVHGAVPNNEQLKMEVFTSFNCGTSIYTQNFTTTNSNVSLGNVIVPSTVTNVANVAGTVTNCNNTAVTNGYLIMLKNNQYFRYNLSNTGTYDFSTLLCNGSENVSLIAEDALAGVQSTPLAYTINSGNNTVSNIQACGVTTEQFFNYTINGTNYTFTSPVDSFYMYVNQQMTPSRIEISAQGTRTSGGSTSSRFGTIGFDQTGVGVGSSQLLSLYFVSEISDSTTYNAPIMVNITEYGNVGQFIAGNYAGTMTGGAPLNTVYNISGSFRVRRNQ